MHVACDTAVPSSCVVGEYQYNYMKNFKRQLVTTDTVDIRIDWHNQHNHVQYKIPEQGAALSNNMKIHLNFNNCKILSDYDHP